MPSVKIATNDSGWGGPIARAKGVPSAVFSTARFLDEAALAGYRGIELSPGMLTEVDDVAGIRDALTRRGLAVSGAVIGGHLEDSDAWPSLEQQTRRAAEALAPFGANQLVLIDMPHLDGRPPDLSEREWSDLVVTSGRLAALAASFGLVLAFHPHADSHVESREQIDRFLAETDPSSVAICLDTGHLAYSGIDPAEFFRRHGKRVTCLHLKNIRRDVWERHRRGRLPWLEAVKLGVAAELTDGIVDLEALRDGIAASGFDGWVVVETERKPSAGDGPLDAVRRAREHLRALGFG